MRLESLHSTAHVPTRGAGRWPPVGRGGLRRLRRALLYLLLPVGYLWRPRRRRSGLPRRILVVKPDHLGDVLLATPALRRLRQRAPYATLEVLAGPWARPVLVGNPDIDAWVALPFPGFERKPPVPPSPSAVRRRPGLLLHRLDRLVHPYRMLLYYAALVRAGQFDEALILRDDHWWGAALTYLAGIPQRIGYAVPECRPFLTQALPWNPSDHVTVQALRLVDTTPPHDPHSTSLRYDPAESDIAWAHTWLTAHGVGPTDRLIVLHPGTGGAAKQWPPEHWAAVADTLAGEPHTRLLLTGGPGETALVATLAAHMRQQPLVLAGATSVGQLAALLRQAVLVLGVDSGPLHIAVSQGTPSLHLFGPSDAMRFGPWGDRARHVVLRAGLWCSPCGMFDACPRRTDPAECMEKIPVDTVVQAARALLDLRTTA